MLASLIYATILSEPSFEDAVCHRLAQRLEHSVDAGLLHKTFHEVLAADQGLGDVFRADLIAVAKRDPACRRLIDPCSTSRAITRSRRTAFRTRSGAPGATISRSICRASPHASSRSIFIPRRRSARA